MEKLLYRGSVKDIYTTANDNTLLFKFSDRYSIFDWGEMPDHIEEKGKTLSFFTKFIFGQFEKPNFWKMIKSELPNELIDTSIFQRAVESGLRTHLNSYVDEDNNPTDKITQSLLVDRVKVKRPSFAEGNWDYSFYKNGNITEHLVPLEVIFRFGVPKGSSLLKRVTDEKYAKALGLTSTPKVGDILESPIVEFSTKLESTDRYVSKEEAFDIAGLSETEGKQLEAQCLLLAYGTNFIFKKIGVQVWDGKFEFSFTGNGEVREFKLVDAIGPDELRLTYKDISLSKENLRQVYSDSNWHRGIEKAKNIAKERKLEDWKTICESELKLTPPRIESEKLETFSMLYRSLANELSKHLEDKEAFPGAWPMEKLQAKIKALHE